jgi:hypothetical protein
LPLLWSLVRLNLRVFEQTEARESAATNNDCIITPPTNSFTFTSNVTSELSTCEALGLSMTGGTSPYLVSFVAANAPSVTNVTLPRGDDLYTYINRASPGGQLVGA